MKLFLLTLILTSCNFTNEGTIQINSLNGKDSPIDDTVIDDSLTDDIDSTSNGSNPSGSNSSSVSLIFNEDFESGIDSNKWHLYKSHNGVSSSILSNNSSSSWSANYTSSTKWHAQLTTKQSFNLPITIEFDLDMASNYTNGSASEGLCIFEDDPSTNFTRDSWYQITSATNLGCIRIQRRLNLNTVPVLYLTGIFFTLVTQD